jgi:hypothetical protein
MRLMASSKPESGAEAESKAETVPAPDAVPAAPVAVKGTESEDDTPPKPGEQQVDSLASRSEHLGAPWCVTAHSTSH